jgi:hypothetical protein
MATATVPRTQPRVGYLGMDSCRVRRYFGVALATGTSPIFFSFLSMSLTATNRQSLLLMGLFGHLATLAQPFTDRT